jgi:hypothetical protein
MEGLDIFKDYGPIGAVVAIVLLFLRDRRASNDRLFAIMDQTKEILIEVRDLLRYRLRVPSDTNPH